MPAKLNRPVFDQRTHTRTDAYGDHLRDLATRVLIPRIAAHQRAALNVAPDLFYFYQKINSGRSCSCAAGVESSPAAGCPVCFGAGITGGYEKYGHSTEILDVTSSWASINVGIDYRTTTRPLHFVLSEDTAVRGYVEFNLPLLPNVGKCSLVQVGGKQTAGTQLTSWVKRYDETDFVPLNARNIEDRLAAATPQGGMIVRVVMSRNDLTVPSPRLSHIRIRVQRLDADVIRADVPRTTQSNRSSEFGFFEDYATRNFYLDDTLRAISTEDFFEQVTTQRRWKLGSVNPNAPAGILTSWDCEASLVQATDIQSRVP